MHDANFYLWENLMSEPTLTRLAGICSIGAEGTKKAHREILALKRPGRIYGDEAEGVKQHEIGFTRVATSNSKKPLQE